MSFRSLLKVFFLLLAACATSPSAYAYTRFYLQNVASTFSPANRGAWDQSGEVTRIMSPTKSGAVTTRAVAETNATNNWDVLLTTFVSQRLAAQTISGTINVVMGTRESSTAANDGFHIHVYVVDAADTLRGTLLADFVDPLPSGADEWPTTAVGNQPTAAQALANLDVNNGDFLVIEIGYVAQNTSTTSRTGTVWYGGTGGDLTVGGDETTLTGFIDFSNDVLLFRKIITSGEQ